MSVQIRYTVHLTIDHFTAKVNSRAEVKSGSIQRPRSAARPMPRSSQRSIPRSRSIYNQVKAKDKPRSFPRATSTAKPMPRSSPGKFHGQCQQLGLCRGQVQVISAAKVNSKPRSIPGQFHGQGQQLSLYRGQVQFNFTVKVNSQGYTEVKSRKKSRLYDDFKYF